MKQIQIYDATNIDTLKWPETEEGQLAKRYLYPLIQEGTENFIANAKTRLHVLMLDELVIPISVNETEYDNSYLLSSYFIVANLKEKLERTSKALKLCSMPMVNLCGQTLKWVKINKAVIINNWLMTTNLYPDLTNEQIKTITLFLKNRFPHHYLMFRSINTYKNSMVYEGLKQQNYRMIPSRQVYLYDPSRKSELSVSMIRKQKKDTNRIKKEKFEIKEASSLSEKEISRVLELYRSVYVSKYTKFSPLYTKKYLEQALKNKTLKFKLLVKDNEIYGVAGFLQKNGYLLIPFFGYDTTLPQEIGLYRMLSSVIMQEIEKYNLISHQGSGAPNFKKWRGFIEQQEYVAIHDQHLPFFRRAFWFLGEKFSSRFNHLEN